MSKNLLNMKHIGHQTGPPWIWIHPLQNIWEFGNIHFKKCLPKSPPRITQPSNDDYDNDGSDDCDYNFVTFDDFGVKNDQQVYT